MRITIEFKKRQIEWKTPPVPDKKGRGVGRFSQNDGLQQSRTIQDSEKTGFDDQPSNKSRSLAKFRRMMLPYLQSDLNSGHHTNGITRETDAYTETSQGFLTELPDQLGFVPGLHGPSIFELEGSRGRFYSPPIGTFISQNISPPQEVIDPPETFQSHSLITDAYLEGQEPVAIAELPAERDATATSVTPISSSANSRSEGESLFVSPSPSLESEGEGDFLFMALPMQYRCTFLEVRPGRADRRDFISSDAPTSQPQIYELDIQSASSERASVLVFDTTISESMKHGMALGKPMEEDKEADSASTTGHVSENMGSNQVVQIDSTVIPLSDELGTSSPIAAKRALSARPAAEPSFGLRIALNVCPNRSVSAPYTRNSVEKGIVTTQCMAPALNGVSIYYATKTDQIIISPDGQGLVQLTNSQKIRRCSSFKTHVSILRTQSVNSVKIIRSYTVKHTQKILASLPFSSLLRSRSLENDSLIQSAKQFQDTRLSLEKKARPRHRFYGGKISTSARSVVMRAAYPHLRCDQCQRAFTGNDRKRKLARHRKKLHPIASTSAEVLETVE